MKLALSMFAGFVAAAALNIGWLGFMGVAVLVLLVFYAKSKAKPDFLKAASAEDDDPEAEASLPTRAKVSFDYVDAQGNPTRRSVSVKAHDTRGKTGILRAWCHEKGAMRSFRFDRISNAVDTETGELLPNLQKHLNTITKR